MPADRPLSRAVMRADCLMNGGVAAPLANKVAASPGRVKMKSPTPPARMQTNLRACLTDGHATLTLPTNDAAPGWSAADRNGGFMWIEYEQFVYRHAPARPFRRMPDGQGPRRQRRGWTTLPGQDSSD